MTILKKIFSNKQPPQSLTRSCVDCENLYEEFEVIPDCTDIRNVKVVSWLSRNYCSIHMCTLPETIDNSGKVVINAANCNQFIHRKKP